MPRMTLQRFFPGQGEVACRLRELDWSANPLGHPRSWPQSLRTIVRVMLGSRYAMWMAWGPEFTFFCNDAYLPTVGIKRDWVLGADARKVWEEIWPDIGPRIDRVLSTGQATWDEGLLLMLERSGYPEETYHTFSYSPAADDGGNVHGMLCVVTEETERVIGERRLASLRELSSRLTSTKSEPEVLEAVARSVDTEARDLPFTLTYIFEPDGMHARLACATGTAGEPTGDLDALDVDTSIWPLRAVSTSLEPLEVTALPAACSEFGAAVWGKPPSRALVLPIAQQGQRGAAGIFIAGLNPYRRLDSAYVDFAKLFVGQIAAGLANARAYDAERRRAESLAELDRAKTTFFSNVSHEFRTPLTLMMAPLEDVLRGDVGPVEDAARSHVALAHRNGVRLQKLVNTLLDFSRIEAGRELASYEAVDLAVFTAELASVFRSAINRAGLQLIVTCAPLAEAVYVDRSMWEKIVLNLLSNALKFTLEGEIRVSLVDAGDHIELSVEDTGTGIPPDALPHVFERFYRVPDARGRTHEGTGIGLALVHGLVKLHSGTISVASEVNRGTRFTVSLPRGSAHIAPASIATKPKPVVASSAPQAYVEEALRWLPDGGAAQDLIETQVLPPASSDLAFGGLLERPATVVLADDNSDMRDYLQGLLANRFRVLTAADGQEALEIIARTPPDLVLTDVMMPRLDGFGLLRALRNDPQTREIPIILLSARAGEEARIGGLEAGADDYLIKPFSARELVARVNAHVTMARMRRENRQALRESEERFRIMADSSPDLIWVLDPGGRVLFVNRAFCEFFGTTQEQIENAGWEHVLHPDDMQAYIERVQSGLREQTRFSARGRVRRWEGTWRWLQSHAAPRVSAEGTFLGAVGSSHDVTELIHAEEGLKEADRRKDEFLATLAHELRNPLAPIRQAARISKSPQATPEQIRWSHDVIERQVQHMSLLLDDLLDVSRITRGKLTLRKEELELRVALDAALESARPLIESHDHRLEIDLPQHPLPLVADPLRLAQIFSNLLTNAAKYTDAGGVISVSAHREADDVFVRFRDSGIGISMDALPRLFEMFSQAQSAIERAQGGLGIGLALSRGLVELHGGTLSAASDGPGRGSEFTVRLPAAPAVGLSDVLPLPQAAESGKTSMRRKVLVVDDNMDAAESLALLLGLEGHDVRTARDGSEGLACGATFEPDVMLVDIGMPKLNGYELAKRVRDEPWGEHVMLIAITGWGQREDRQRALTAGFELHMTKPVDPAAICALLQSDRLPHA